MDYYFEFGGGLGDIFHRFFSGGEYRAIEKCGPQDHARITIFSINPFADELFKWHRKKNQLDVKLFEYWPDHISDIDSTNRTRYGLPQQSAIMRLEKTAEPVTFYPSAEDLEIIQRLDGLKYVVVAASASNDLRAFPDAILTQICEEAKEHNIHIVAVGRQYVQQSGCKRREPAVPKNGLTIDFVDRLSVPATARVVEGAEGVICTHSAISLLAWHLQKPVLLLYPQEVFDYHIAQHPRPGFYTTFGLDYATTRHALFQNFSRQLMRDFFEIVFKHSGVSMTFG
jgi:ADP-heptose:LPS heptosyltransferase